jgi:protein-S-isoprenylcysteine O-methyltransferase Ste14
VDNTLFLVVVSSTFVSFVWAVKRLFRAEDASVGMRAITVLGPMGFLLDVACIFWYPASLNLTILASSVNFVAQILFWWAAATVRNRQLSLAFSRDEPTFLIQDGPYRLIRHPFYTSYILFWISNSLASDVFWPWLVFTAMTTIYLIAVRFEERKFSTSPFATAYSGYRRVTGAIVPRLWQRCLSR